MFTDAFRFVIFKMKFIMKKLPVQTFQHTFCETNVHRCHKQHNLQLSSFRYSWQVHSSSVLPSLDTSSLLLLLIYLVGFLTFLINLGVCAEPRFTPPSGSASEKVLLESCDNNSRISPNNFSHNNNFCQPNVNSVHSFNANFKKQRKSVANPISNKAKNTNHNLDIEGLINLRKLYTNKRITGYLNVNSLRNKITQSREVCRKAAMDLLCID